MASGVPFLKDEVKVGWSDFSEFSVAAGLPSGITEFGVNAGSPSAVAIVNDPSEGNYFEMTGQTAFDAWAFGLDSFFGQIEFGEMLARVFFNVPRNNRTSMGPVFSLKGALEADLDWTGGRIQWGISDDLRSMGAKSVGGSGGVPLQPFVQEAVQQSTWMWIRVRRLQGVGDPAKDDWQVTAWYGDLEDEPVAIDGFANDATVAPRGLLAMGWGVVPVASDSDQRIAFLSFSADPLIAAPPLAGESADRWFPSNVPGASSWVPSNVPGTTTWVPSNG